MKNVHGLAWFTDAMVFCLGKLNTSDSACIKIQKESLEKNDCFITRNRTGQNNDQFCQIFIAEVRRDVLCCHWNIERIRSSSSLFSCFQSNRSLSGYRSVELVSNGHCFEEVTMRCALKILGENGGSLFAQHVSYCWHCAAQKANIQWNVTTIAWMHVIFNGNDHWHQEFHAIYGCLR